MDGFGNRAVKIFAMFPEESGAAAIEYVSSLLALLLRLRQRR